MLGPKIFFPLIKKDTSQARALNYLINLFKMPPRPNLTSEGLTYQDFNVGGPPFIPPTFSPSLPPPEKVNPD